MSQTSFVVLDTKITSGAGIGKDVCCLVKSLRPSWSYSPSTVRLEQTLSIPKIKGEDSSPARLVARTGYFISLRVSRIPGSCPEVPPTGQRIVQDNIYNDDDNT